MISEQDAQAYQRDGVIVVPEVLDRETLAEVRSVIAELVAGSAGTLEHTEIYDLEPGHTAAEPRVRRIKAPHKVHAVLRLDGVGTLHTGADRWQQPRRDDRPVRRREVRA